MKRKILVVAAVVMYGTLQAQTEKQNQELDEVVVTATKQEQKQSQTGKVVTVITKEQLEKSSGKTLGQLLNEQAGIVVNGALNGPARVQTVFTRGASSGRTLILIDGIPVNDPSMINNEFDLNLISITDVERIEICKGAQSTLYGSDAIGGVINISTVKKDVQKPFNVKLFSGFGNKNTFRNNLQLFGKAGRFTYTTRFSKLKTDGFSAAYDSTGNKNFDKDGYDGNVINAALQYQLSQSFSLKSFIQHSQYKAGIDAGVFTDDKDYNINNRNLSAGMGFQFKKGIVTITGNYQYGQLQRKYLNDSAYVAGFAKFERNTYDARTQYLELYGNVTVTKWLAILTGADYRWATMHQNYFSISSFGPYKPAPFDSSLHQISYYASLLLNTPDKRFNLEIGGRSNDHSRYGNNTTYTINPSVNVSEHFRIFGSIASGFKAPSIFQLYDQFSGNLSLKAENSVNYEMGVQQLHHKINSRLVFFHRNINNGIDYNYVTQKYFNFVKQKVNGIELEINTNPVNNLFVTANYTFLAGKEITQSRKSYNDTTYNYMLRRPRHNININVGYNFSDKIYASIAGKYVSNRYDVGGFKKNDILLNSYALLNAYAEYKHNNHLKFFTDLQNITGKKFFDLYGYNSIPFMLNGGVKVEF